MQPLGISLESKHCTNERNNAELHSLAKHCPQKSGLVIGLPASKILFQKIPADHGLSEDDLTTFITSRLTALFGARADTLLWDYEKHSKDNQEEITIIAAEKSTVDAIKNTFAQHHITIKAIEPTAFALARQLIEKTGIHHCYALIPNEDDFIFITLHDRKIFHYEKLARSQLCQLSLMIQLELPFYLINNEETHKNPVSLTSNDLILSQEMLITTLSLNCSDALSTWKKS